MNMQLTAMLTQFLLVFLIDLIFSWPHISYPPIPTISLHSRKGKATFIGHCVTWSCLQ